MGELVRMVLEKLTRHGVLFGGRGSEPLFTPEHFPTKYISEILSDMLLFREVCIVVSRRSANLGAAGYLYFCALALQ
uniref:Phosphotransferase n=1 Tax=Parascaris equorum TaxID=6256 RepID=A0A914RAS3_PAREQ